MKAYAKLRPMHTTLPACFRVDAWGARLAIVRRRANIAKDGLEARAENVVALYERVVPLE